MKFAALSTIIVSSLQLSSTNAFSTLSTNAFWRKSSTVASSSSQLFSAEATLQESNTFNYRAREVFDMVDVDNSRTITSTELGTMLQMLDIAATDEEVNALFNYLDEEGDGEIRYEQFEPWYSASAEQAQSDAIVIQNAILTRKSVNRFDATPVDKAVLERAVNCAIASPSIGGRLAESWRFIDVGPQTVKQIAQLKAKILEQTAGTTSLTAVGEFKPEELEQIPGWCVVTSKKSANADTQDEEQLQIDFEDYGATCCAIQSFMLSMWSEGVGTKWAAGPISRMQEFADLCGVDTETERVVGILLYGFASGGMASIDKTPREKGVDDVLSTIP